jgi:hypothetical protein
MGSQKKQFGIVAFIVGILVSIPRPAQAFSLPGPLNSFVNAVFTQVGARIGVKLDSYIELGLGKLDNILGIDPGTVSGDLGIIDPLQAAQAIDQKPLSQFQSDLQITPTAQGELDKGRFNTGFAAAIGGSIFSTDTQAALKDSSDTNQKLTEGSGQLAQEAQGEKVTQNIAKIQTKQNAQTIGVLNSVSEKQDLQLQQEGATAMASAQTAKHANNEEAETAQNAANEAAYTTQQSGMADGVIGGIGK